MLKSYGKDKLLGLARLVQATPTQCVVEATIDGLPEGEYRFIVHEFGDLSQGCERWVGDDSGVTIHGLKSRPNCKIILCCGNSKHL